MYLSLSGASLKVMGSDDQDDNTTVSSEGTGANDQISVSPELLWSLLLDSCQRTCSTTVCVRVRVCV